MKRSLVVCVLSLLVQGAYLPSQSAQSTFRVEGIVLESGSERPLAGAKVKLMPGSSLETSTDSRGRFRFDAIATGRYRVVPELDGFVFSRPERLNNPGEPGPWVQLSAGDAAQDIQVRMEPEGIITGAVLDPDGRPLTSASVVISLLRYRYDDEGRKVLQPVPGTKFARTDDRGQYRLFGLQRGDYYLRVATPQLIYHPGTSDEMRATLVHVEPGKELHLGTIVLPQVKITQVRLHFTDAAGALPSRDRNVFFISQKTLTTISKSGDRDGRDLFVFSMHPGRYDATVSWELGGTLLYSKVDLDVVDSDIDQNIVMKPAVRVTGDLLVEDASGNRVRSQGLQCNLRPLTSTQLRSSDLGCINGQFVPGFYRLSLQGMPPDAYVISATIDGLDILAEGIQLNVDTEIHILTGRPGGQIEGSVRNADGARLSDAHVALVPDAPLGGAGALYRSVVSDVNGNFELHGIRPGTYRLYAWPELEGAAYLNAEFMKDFYEKGMPVRIEKGGRVSIEATAF